MKFVNSLDNLEANPIVLGKYQKFQLYEEASLGTIARESTKFCVVLLFAAEWLGSSYILEQFLEEESSAHPDVALFKVDVENNPELTEKMDIRQLPATYFFVNGEIVSYLEGLAGRKKAREKLIQAIKTKAESRKP